MSVAMGSFLLFAAAQVGTPGPANIALLATGAAHGFRAALPFVLGVALGKQLIIWPVGFGMMVILDASPWLHATLKWAAVAYICWLAWRIAQSRLDTTAKGRAPGLLVGLAVHPLNPKAWAMVVTAFAGFTGTGSPVLMTTGMIAAGFLAIQLVLHPIWALFGDRIARVVAGTAAERAMFVLLAVLTVATVFYAMFFGGSAP